MFGQENFPASILCIDAALDDDVVAVVETADFGPDVGRGVGNATRSNDRHLNNLLLLLICLLFKWSGKKRSE